MIAKLKGIVDELKPTVVILDVKGVGYQCYIPFSTFEKMVEKKEVQLYIVTYHREDQLKLYGFYTEQEKELFTILTGISGIGPTMALSILSGIRPEELLTSVKTEKTNLLTRIPGIGKTKAEKLIFDLKRKIRKIELLSDVNIQQTPLRDDAIEALTALGYDESHSMKTVDNIISNNHEISLENLIKLSLKSLSR